MAGIEALAVEADSVVDGESGGGSAEVCDAGIEGLRGQIDALLKEAGTTDRSTIITGEEIGDGFKVVKDNGKEVNKVERGGIGRALGSEFELKIVRKVCVARRRDVSSGSGGASDKPVICKRERRRLGKAERRLRRTNPDLRKVD